MPSVYGLTTEMVLGNLIFSSLTASMYDSRQAKQGPCALVSLHASTV